MDKPLQGKVAVVAGATRGLRKLGSVGWVRLHRWGRQKAPLAQLRERTRALGL